MIYLIMPLIGVAVYFLYKSFSRYKYYKQLKEKDTLTDEEKLWVYCYLHNLSVVEAGNYYYVKRWYGGYIDSGRGTLYWWTEESKGFGRHDSVKDVLKTLEYRYSDKSNSGVMSKYTPPKSNNEEYLSLKQLVEEETDPAEKEMLNRILERLNK